MSEGPPISFAAISAPRSLRCASARVKRPCADPWEVIAEGAEGRHAGEVSEGVNESHPQDARHPERVPGAEAASADDRKFREYILSETHPIGRGKAKFFTNIGYTGANWQELREQFLAQLPRVPGRIPKTATVKARTTKP